MRFKQIYDGGSDEWLWISEKPMTDSDWPVWFFIRVYDMDAVCGRDNEGKPQYHGEVVVVAPDAVGEDERNRAMESCGQRREDETPYAAWMGMSEQGKAEVLLQYGCAAVLAQKSGGSYHRVERALRKEVPMMLMLFGLYMDKQQNAIGDTGWDFIKGDIGKAFRRQS